MTQLSGLELTPSDNIIYNSRGWQIISRSFDLDRTGGTYLFYGPDGVGRWFTAISYAALLNCEEPAKNENQITIPCGQCRNCLNIFALSFESLKLILPIPPHENKLDKAIDLTNERLDIKRGEPFQILSASTSTNIPVAMAREVKKTLSLRAPKGHKRVVLFYQMEKMRTSSADALLKIIEEPPADTVMILVCHKPDSLLSTIQSRSMKIKLDKNRSEDIENYLLANYELSEKRASLVSRLSSGSVGRAIDMLGDDDDDTTSQRAVFFMLFKSLFIDEKADTLAHINEVLSLRDQSEIVELLRLWQLLIRDCSSYAVTLEENDITNIDFKPEIINLSRYFAGSTLGLSMIAEIKNTLADLRRNVHIQGALMALTLKIKNSIKMAS